eukprot:4599132-Amphidinium_carterae.1
MPEGLRQHPQRSKCMLNTAHEKDANSLLHTVVNNVWLPAELCVVRQGDVLTWELEEDMAVSAWS